MGGNTYTGRTYVGGGGYSGIIVNNSLGLGSAAGGTFVLNGAQLAINPDTNGGAVIVAAEPLTLSGVGILTTGNNGALHNSGGPNTWGGPITLDSPLNGARIVSSGGTLTLTGGINSSNSTGLLLGGVTNIYINSAVGSGVVTLIKDNAGTSYLAGTNAYTGRTSVNQGGLRMQTSSALGATGAGNDTVVMQTGAALELDGSAAAISTSELITISGYGLAISPGAIRNVLGTNTLSGAITLGGDAQINSDTGTLTLTGGVSAGGMNLTFGGGGNLVVSTTGLSDVFNLTKADNGKLVLALANTITGAVTVNAGILNLQDAGALGSTTGVRPPYSATPGAAVRTPCRRPESCVVSARSTPISTPCPSAMLKV
jgi:autotransporter-associated beta strand protein